jgi:Cellulose biosynthesis protein BcsS
MDGMWNWQNHLRTALLACVATAGLSTTAAWAGSLKDTPTTDTQRGVYFSGYDVVEGARYAFAGMILALNNDISRDGWALRLYGSRVDFDLDPGDGRGWQGDAMLGYRFVRKHMYGGIYVGGDYQNYRLSPDDPTAKVRGTEVGVKVAAELATSKELPYYFALNGNYSTAFDVYWARARVGLIRGGVTFGPEGIVFGDEEFNAQRLGGFVSFDVKLLPNRPVEITLSAGHQFVNDSGSSAGGGNGIGGAGGGEGTYATIVFSVLF